MEVEAEQGVHTQFKDTNWSPLLKSACFSPVAPNGSGLAFGRIQGMKQRRFQERLALAVGSGVGAASV